MMATVVMGKPMTLSTSSWEGEFTIGKTNTPIRIRGMPTLLLWIYELPAGSKGTVIGFSNEEGDMILAPTPNAMGVQPIYTGHFVTLNDDGTADIIITYSIQGNGGAKWVDKYIYSGESISLQKTTFNSGKRRFEWYGKENEGEQSVPGYPPQGVGSP